MGRQKIYRWHVGKAPRVSRGRKWREMEKDGGRGSTGADRRRNAGKGGGERRGGEGKSERKRTRMVAAGRQMTADRRKTHPNCSTVSLSRLFLRMSPPLRVYILHVAWSRANDLLAKYSGKRRRVPPASFSNEYFDTGDASDVSPSPVSLCLIYRTLVEPASLATSIGRG